MSTRVAGLTGVTLEPGLHFVAPIVNTVDIIDTRVRSIPIPDYQAASKEQQDLFLHGTHGERIYVTYRNRMGRRRSYMAPLEGVVPNLERRYKETDSLAVREELAKFLNTKACPACEGTRLRRRGRFALSAGNRHIRAARNSSGDLLVTTAPLLYVFARPKATASA